MRRLLPVALVLLATTPADADGSLTELKQSVVRQYGVLAHAMYAESERLAATMRDRVRELTDTPTPETLAAAREAWIEARRVYGQTEVFRFYSGPIDHPETGVETLVNAWPLDEAYIDSVEGDPDAGIVNMPQRYPNLNGTMLEVWNERGGEANVSAGWHAIEFLLWGQDHDPDGPGTRPHTDYVVGVGRNAERRASYLRVAADQLVVHLRTVKAAWAPDTGSYRVEFETDDPTSSLRRILTGMTVLSGFEMAGERLAVPYETRDQEEEHSCFSDTTHHDLVANQKGIRVVWEGSWREHEGPGIGDLARAIDDTRAEALDRRIAIALMSVAAIEPPFDRAIRVEDDPNCRPAVLTAIESIEDQAASLSALGAMLGYEIAVEPGE